MRKRYYTIVALLIGAHLLTELHTFIMWVNPKSITMYVDNWFIKPGAVNHLSVLWYFKMIEDSLMVVGIIFAGACQAYSKSYEQFLQWQRYSLRLFSLWGLYFIYHMFDLLMFIYNYKTCYWLYATILLVTTICALLIAFAKEKHFIKHQE